MDFSAKYSQFVARPCRPNFKQWHMGIRRNKWEQRKIDSATNLRTNHQHSRVWAVNSIAYIA